MKSQQTLLFITAGSLTSSQVRFAGISRYAMGRGWNLWGQEPVGTGPGDVFVGARRAGNGGGGDSPGGVWGQAPAALIVLGRKAIALAR